MLHNVIICFLDFYSIKSATFSEFATELTRLNLLSPESVGITGGGSVRFERELKHLFPQAHFFDEIECLVKGLLTSSHHSDTVLLANIGTGASFIKIDSQSGSFARIGGTNLGGSVLAGLCNWKSLPFPSEREGSHARVDTLVSDIYGSDYGSANLTGDCVAGSLGKLHANSNDSDAISGIVFMIASNTAHLLRLNARIHNIKEIILSGSLAGLAAFQSAFNESMSFYNSDNSLSFHFHSQPAYLGCLGIVEQLARK